LLFCRLKRIKSYWNKLNLQSLEEASSSKRRKTADGNGVDVRFNAFESTGNHGARKTGTQTRAETAQVKRPKNEVNVFFEAEILEMNSYQQFSTLGAYVDMEGNERTLGTDVRFFASVLPESLVNCWSEFSTVTRTLLNQRLRIEFQRSPIKFCHQGRGIVPVVTERQALMNFVTWLRGLRRPVRLFVHCKGGRLVADLVGKLEHYGLYPDFARTVSGLCDVTSLAMSRGFTSLWESGEGRQAPDFGSVRAAMTPAVGSGSVEAEESDELAELMGQFVNQVRETGTEADKREFLAQVSPYIHFILLKRYFF
jgi:hypothetical protein